MPINTVEPLCGLDRGNHSGLCLQGFNVKREVKDP